MNMLYVSERDLLSLSEIVNDEGLSRGPIVSVLPRSLVTCIIRLRDTINTDLQHFHHRNQAVSSMSPSNHETLDDHSYQNIEDEVLELEQKLERAKARLKARDNVPNGKAHEPHMSNSGCPRNIKQAATASITSNDSPSPFPNAQINAQDTDTDPILQQPQRYTQQRTSSSSSPTPPSH